jgi:hypothetical protein
MSDCAIENCMCTNCTIENLCFLSPTDDHEFIKRFFRNFSKTNPSELSIEIENIAFFCTIKKYLLTRIIRKHFIANVDYAHGARVDRIKITPTCFRNVCNLISNVYDISCKDKFDYYEKLFLE